MGSNRTGDDRASFEFGTLTYSIAWEPTPRGVGSRIAKLTPSRKIAKTQPRKPSSKPDMRNCAVCGQSFDARSLTQVVHHDANPHEPLNQE
jgi:hypothetical protein